MSDDPQTPSPLDAMSKTDSDRVSKLDILIGYAREADSRMRVVLGRLAHGDAKMAAHEKAIDDLQRKLGRKTKPEPHWTIRAAVIAAIGSVMTVLINFALKGGFSSGVH